MPKTPSNDASRLPYPWLPWIIGTLGIFLSLLVWLDRLLPVSVVHSHEYSIPLILFILGISLSTAFGFGIRVLQVTQQRKKLYEIINEEFQKEIAERMRAEETKQNLEKALLQGQKLQAIGTLAGGIAHDFNNLLYAIIGYVEMARDDVPKDSLTHKNLGKVIEASRRGQELVAGILAFSRRQHHEFKPICIKKTIETVLDLLAPTIPASVTINFSSMETDSEILGNQTLLHQVMVNIVNNAVDAMDGEGKVEIKLDRISPDNKILQQFPKIEGTYYCKIEISDTGHGIEQNTIERIFEPFFTTKEVGKGTGLGLSTVHAIMKEHQGEVLVKSQLGHGTTFILLLPEYSDKEKKNG